MILYTCANDGMIEFLKITLVAARTHVPAAEIRIIPFDDNVALTLELASRIGAKVIEADPYWDEVGKHLYGDTEYRPGVLSYRYFRKLNVFNGLPEHFLFFDANMAILSNLDQFFEAYRLRHSSVVFSHFAKPRQFKTFATPVLRLLNPAMRFGYGCSGIMGRGDAISRNDTGIFLRNKNWKRLFGKAPEQAFMSALSALTGSSWQTFSQLLGFGARNIVSSGPLRQLRPDGNCYFTQGDIAGRLSHFCKWTHQSLRSDANNIELYLALKEKAAEYLREAA